MNFFFLSIFYYFFIAISATRSAEFTSPIMFPLFAPPPPPLGVLAAPPPPLNAAIGLIPAACMSFTPRCHAVLLMLSWKSLFCWFCSLAELPPVPNISLPKFNISLPKSAHPMFIFSSVLVYYTLELVFLLGFQS